MSHQNIASIRSSCGTSVKTLSTTHTAPTAKKFSHHWHREYKRHKKQISNSLS